MRRGGSGSASRAADVRSPIAAMIAHDRTTLTEERWPIFSDFSPLSMIESSASGEPTPSMPMTRRSLSDLSSAKLEYTLSKSPYAQNDVSQAPCTASLLVPSAAKSSADRIIIPMFFLFFSNFWLILNFWQTLRGPFSAALTPNFASK